jgi:hypothetical protein
MPGMTKLQETTSRRGSIRVRTPAVTAQTTRVEVIHMVNTTNLDFR